MNTILLTTMCDSISVKVCETAIRLMNEAGTNPADVAIACTISDAIVKIVTICVGGFLVWKLMDHLAKGIAGWNKRVWDVEDIERKQKSDLQTRLLDFQKELAVPYDKTKDEFKKISYDEDKCQKYIDKLETCLKQLKAHENQEQTKPVA